MQLEGAVIGGDFRVEREIARGGMGGVWLAEQISTGQKRALKVMHPTLIAQPRMRERFEQEARVGARIPSEHVVEVIAAGVDPLLGIPWLAMELLHGEDLGQLCARRGPLPAPELVPIFRQLCHALAAAHSVGVVHRDIKPENVFMAELQSAEATRQVKVLDFGIAKLVADAKDSATGQVGTPLWMAPEQSDPRAAIGPPADVWALGLLAFRLLTGRHYWVTANDSSAALSALLRETLMEPIVAASERARQYGMEGLLPPGFDAWFAHTVAREPGHRFPEAHAAFAAFEAMTLGTLPSARASVPFPQPQATPASVAAVSASQPVSANVAPAARGSKAPLFIALGGLLFLVGAVLVVALGAGAWLYTSDSASSGPAARPDVPAAQPGASGQSPVEAAGPTAAEPGTKSPSTTKTAARTATGPLGTSPSPTAEPAKGPEPAPSPTPTPSATGTTAAAGDLKPIDVASVQAKVNARAAAAAVECAKFKTPGAASETFPGSCGFRPDGSTAGGMSGMGGSQPCVKEKMLSMKIGKYAHPKEWHVEIFNWTVTVK